MEDNRGIVFIFNWLHFKMEKWSVEKMGGCKRFSLTLAKGHILCIYVASYYVLAEDELFITSHPNYKSLYIQYVNKAFPFSIN